MIRMRATLTLTALFVLALAIPAGTAATTPPPQTAIAQVALGSFSATASGPINGWYWMRSGSFADVGTWTFSSFDPAALKYTKKLYVALSPLVTNTTNGGAGWNARLKVTVRYVGATGTKVYSKSVTTTNPFPARSVKDSNGIGYQAYASFDMPQSWFKYGAGTLTVEVRRDSAYKLSGYKPHVGIRDAAVQLWYYAAP